MELTNMDLSGKFDAEMLRSYALNEAKSVIHHISHGHNIRYIADAWGKACAYNTVLSRNYGIDLENDPVFAKARLYYLGE